MDNYCYPEYISECCYAPPLEVGYIGLDMSTVPYGGPSGFCSKCFDNCIFNIEGDEDDDTIPTSINSSPRLGK